MQKRPLFPSSPVLPPLLITPPKAKTFVPAARQVQRATLAAPRSAITMPPVYRPQNTSMVVQAKTASVSLAPRPAGRLPGAPRSAITGPHAYRPQNIGMVAQAKTASVSLVPTPTGRLPAVPPVFKVESRSTPLQAKSPLSVQSTEISQRLAARWQQARSTKVVQRAATGWDADASDTESELDDDVDEGFASTVTNLTKKKAKRVKNSISYTLREADGSRSFPRINNRQESDNGLAHDARQIHDTIPEFDSAGKKSRSFGATTVVCALFQKNDGGFRKYCYNNLHRTAPTNMREMAEALGYHFVIAEQAHAEAEMVMHSHTRTGMRLLAIGCDKDHCAECGKIMKCFYSEEITSENTYSDAIFDNYYMPKTLQDALGVADDERPSKW
jgi:hypothetical protein